MVSNAFARMDGQRRVNETAVWAALLAAFAMSGCGAPRRPPLPTCADQEPITGGAERPAVAPLPSPGWNQWRGAGRDGIGSAEVLPAELPDELRLLWCVEVGEGFASPLVDSETIYVHVREGAEEVAKALALADGRTIWRQAYAAPYTMTPAAIDMGPGPKSTPILADGRLFTFGITEILSAWNAATGELLWRKEFSNEFATTSPLYGAAMSPIVVDDMLVAHVGGEEEGALRAFDTKTGVVKWETHGLPPGYASPIVFENDGRRHLVTQSKSRIVGVDVTGGTINWEMPFETSLDQNIVTPVADSERLIFSGLEKGVFAVELRGGRTVEIWRNDEFPMRMTSPVVVGDRMFGMSHRRMGQFFSLDVASGDGLWTSVGREAFNTAIVALGNRIAFLTDEARLIIIAADAAVYEPLAEYEVASSATWAHPVFVPGGVLIKDVNTLRYWSF